MTRFPLAVGVAAVLLAGLLTPAAFADVKVPLGGGAGIAVNGDLCTLTTIGHDRAGDLVGFSSAHCGGPGAGVAGEGRDGIVGSVVAAEGGLDFCHCDDARRVIATVTASLVTSSS
jgi:hypothetical protein